MSQNGDMGHPAFFTPLKQRTLEWGTRQSVEPQRLKAYRRGPLYPPTKVGGLPEWELIFEVAEDDVEGFGQGGVGENPIL